MNSTLAEVLDAARALPRSERAEVAHELIATLAATDEFNEARHAELRAAVAEGAESLESGQSKRLSIEDLEDYMRERSRQATKRAAAKSA